MATQKLLIRNVSPNPILFNYQNSTDRIWYYQIIILPGQERTIWCVENTLSYSGPNNGLFITNKTTTVYMLVFRRFANKDYLRCFKGVFFVKSKL